MTTDIERYTDAMAELVVRFGANVQPGQVVAIGAEPGKEEMVRAIAEHAYRAGAKFVDLSVFDVYVRRSACDDAVRPTYRIGLTRVRLCRASVDSAAAPVAACGRDPRSAAAVRVSNLGLRR